MGQRDGPPRRICSWKIGTTLPRLPSTLPKRTETKHLTVLARPSAAHDQLRDRLRDADHRDRVHRLVRGHVHEASTPASSGAHGDVARAADVVQHRLVGMVLHQRDVLVSRGMEHDIGPYAPITSSSFAPSGTVPTTGGIEVGHSPRARGRPRADCSRPDRTAPPAWVQAGDLAHDLGADRAAGAGDEDDALGSSRPPRGRARRAPAAAGPRPAHRALAKSNVAGEDLGDAGQDAALHACLGRELDHCGCDPRGRRHVMRTSSISCCARRRQVVDAIRAPSRPAIVISLPGSSSRKPTAVIPARGCRRISRAMRAPASPAPTKSTRCSGVSPPTSRRPSSHSRGAGPGVPPHEHDREEPGDQWRRAWESCDLVPRQSQREETTCPARSPSRGLRDRGS